MSSTSRESTSTSSSTMANISGHAQYVKGAAEGAVASLSGSEAWASSAEQDKQAGVDTIRSATAATQDDSLAAKACPVVGGGVGQPADSTGTSSTGTSSTSTA